MLPQGARLASRPMRESPRPHFPPGHSVRRIRDAACLARPVAGGCRRGDAGLPGNDPARKPSGLTRCSARAERHPCFSLAAMDDRNCRRGPRRIASACERSCRGDRRTPCATTRSRRTARGSARLGRRRRTPRRRWRPHQRGRPPRRNHRVRGHPPHRQRGHGIRHRLQSWTPSTRRRSGQLTSRCHRARREAPRRVTDSLVRLRAGATSGVAGFIFTRETAGGGRTFRR